MQNELRGGDFTGRSYFKKRLFGGWNIFVERIGYYMSSDDGSTGPDFKYWTKLTERDVVHFGITHPDTILRVFVQKRIFGGWNVKVQKNHRKLGGKGTVYDEAKWETASVYDVLELKLTLFEDN